MLTRLMFGGGGYCAGIDNASWTAIRNVGTLLLWL